MQSRPEVEWRISFQLFAAAVCVCVCEVLRRSTSTSFCSCFFGETKCQIAGNRQHASSCACCISPCTVNPVGTLLILALDLVFMVAVRRPF